MSKFEVKELPGGEIILGRALTKSKDGVDDYDQFLLRQKEQATLIKWLWKNRGFEIEKLCKGGERG